MHTGDPSGGEDQLPVRSRSPDAALRESEERFRGAFATAAIGFALVEPDGRLRAVNQMLCAMLGYEESELVGQPFPSFAYPADRALDEAVRTRLLAGESGGNHVEKRYVRKDSRIVWGLLAYSLVRDENGTPINFVAQVTDINRQKEAEHALAVHAADLERSNRDLEEFAYVASHDLQEPLRVVASYTKLLSERYDGRFSAEGKRWMDHIASGVARMQRLIDDLLALARLRTDGAVFAATDLGAVAEGAWRALSEQRGHLETVFTLEPLPTVEGDAAQLGLVFQNLLGNALKSRRATTPLTLHVFSHETTHDGRAGWRITVEDNGIGLDMADAERIFEIFERLHREENNSGTGIGLAICRRIIERHGGRIWVDSIPGEGSRFQFALPQHARH